MENVLISGIFFMMDPKELKKLLKEARTALKEKDYAEAVKLCKVSNYCPTSDYEYEKSKSIITDFCTLLFQTILKAEPNNYTALVITGAAYSNQDKTQQCVEAYKQAISAQPNNVPAWQGLVQHYEKIGKSHHPDLVEAYKRIAAYHER